MVWNCKGSLQIDIGYFEDTLKQTDIAMYTEIHQCIGSKLSNVHAIDDSQYVDHNHVFLKALKALEECQCYTNKNFVIKWVWCIRLWMHVICGYKANGEFLKCYILQFVTSHYLFKIVQLLLLHLCQIEFFVIFRMCTEDKLKTSMRSQTSAITF